MLFYKFQGLIKDDLLCEDRASKRDFARRLCVFTLEFNEKDVNNYVFVSDVIDDEITIGLITKYFVDPIDVVKAYIDFIPLDACDFIVDEVTINKMVDMLDSADRCSFIDDDNEVLEKFEIDKILGHRGRGISYGENLSKEIQNKEDLIALSNKYFMSETLTPEIERIYAGKKNKRALGHPVHYILECDDFDTRREVYKLVLDALYTNGRLDSKRYAFLDFRPGENYSQMAYETLYKICRGGAVVVRYLAGDDSESNGYAGGEYDTIENICEMAKRYRNEVLTIICFPCECTKIKATFFENLGTMSFIEIREDFIKVDCANAFLTALSKENHIRPDKKLYSKIEDDKTYLASELKVVFNDWYNEKLKSSVYPQYKDISVARKEVIKAKPQGSAFDELEEMIGLNEAKQVIKKALNYYKMQKIYEERGVKASNPAMHMIFSGNPGTAKTTVARLFARIMRENKLLSRGHLVEVGRGDLVGKFVGWTAQIVQSKFKEAQGGVLFIDEAYSLVDGHGGSFGDEAINTIVQEMENHRGEVVVIFAGYPDKMESFLATNPGLRSRIAFHVPFADYNSEELCQIAKMISKQNGMKIEKEALTKLEKVFDIAKNNSDFGNGRYVRNIFEQAKMNQASRLISGDIDNASTDDIITITAEDIIMETSISQTKPEKKRIGFC